MAGDLSASNARRESVIFVYCSIEASSFCGTVEPYPNEQRYTDIRDTMMPLAALSIWPPRLFVTWGPGGEFLSNARLSRWHCMWKRSCIPSLSAPTVLRKSLF